ncbi:MAG: DegT/DnrJ/EryC1/StrS family aminotransferase [Anaerolineae bacterium]|jgi:dTDP-4-amino-4,6-dideoxygalactose transaminase|nr:aminotransferase class I/II-fold pyridoxal phosphate-dependent enzyme [Chloroflexota bacterium]
MTERLAIDGGQPVRAERLRAGFHGSSEIDASEVTAVTDVLKEKTLFRFIAEPRSRARWIEDWYCERLGRKYALAVSSGTSALISALMGVDAGPGDEVIIPAYTFVATAAAVIAAGAVPVLAEVDASLNLDPVDLERKITPYTVGVIPVHMRGVPARMDEILAVARRHKLWVVEDVAQSNGGSYRGKPLGTLGEVGCFSFQQYKVITSGEGGIVVTDDVLIHDRARMQHDAAARFWEESQSEPLYNFVISGENYRLSETAAALVWAQRERLGPILNQCRAVKARAVAGLAQVPGITLQDVPDPEGDCGITLTFFAPSAESAQRMAAALNAENIACGTVHDRTIPDRHIYNHWPFMMSGLAEDRRAPWKDPRYKGAVSGYSREQCPQSLDLLSRAIMIMIDQHFTLQDADLIVQAVDKVARHLLPQG